MTIRRPGQSVLPLTLTLLFTVAASQASRGQSNASALPSAPIDLSYTVQEGDTVEAIAKLFVVRDRDIRVLNHIPDGASLRPGTVIKIPIGGPTEPSTREPSRDHRISSTMQPVWRRLQQLHKLLLWVLPVLTLAVVAVRWKRHHAIHDIAFAAAALVFLISVALTAVSPTHATNWFSYAMAYLALLDLALIVMIVGLIALLRRSMK